MKKYNPETMLREISLKIEKDYRLNSRFVKAGKWRGLFDLFSSEWKMSSIDNKIKLLCEISALSKRSLSYIVFAFKEYWLDKRPDISQAADESVCEILSFYIEALKKEDTFLRSLLFS